LEGQDLSAHLQSIWTDDEVFGLLSDLGHALQACHDLSVVHRDLSPGNVRRLPSGSYVLMDPGYAKHLRLAAITGVFQPGTPGFRSPEHVAGGNPTAASDIYSLGVLGYYGRSGQFPIDPTGLQAEYDRRLLNTAAPSLVSVAPDSDVELVRILDRCLQRQPARRFLDGSELLEQLSAIGRVR
jgi:serine/threonine-protein kinase